jgi:hypothetical protein
LFPTSFSEKTVDVEASKDETKYIQHSIKSKKKRRAPAPPTTSQTNPAVEIPSQFKRLECVEDQTTAAPAVRKTLFPTSSSEKTVDVEASKDETKYIQHSIKSKRRAPAPPTTSQTNPAVEIPSQFKRLECVEDFNCHFKQH